MLLSILITVNENCNNFFQLVNQFLSIKYFLYMGIINECMLNQEKARVPSQVGGVFRTQNDLNYYRQTYQNSSRYNDYLGQQCYRTQVIEPSEKNSVVYMKLNNCSQPPSQVFNKMVWLRQDSQMNEHYQPMKIRRTNQCQSQTVNRPKLPRKSAQPLSYKPIKPHEKDNQGKPINSIEETLQTEV